LVLDEGLGCKEWTSLDLGRLSVRATMHRPKVGRLKSRLKNLEHGFHETSMIEPVGLVEFARVVVVWSGLGVGEVNHTDFAIGRTAQRTRLSSMGLKLYMDHHVPRAITIGFAHPDDRLVCGNLHHPARLSQNPLAYEQNKESRQERPAVPKRPGG